MDNQEAFNRVAEHLLTQKEKCGTGRVGGGFSCRYRYEDMKCAIGALIPDALYTPAMEHHTIITLLENKREFPQISNLFDGVSIPLLRELQSIHDCCHPEIWRRELRIIGNRFELAFPEILNGD